MFSYRIMNSVGVQSLRRPVTDDIGKMAKIQLFYVRFGQKNGAGVVHIDGKCPFYHAYSRGVFCVICPLQLSSVQECKDVAEIIREIFLRIWL